MKIAIHGAASEVTGSASLVETGGARVLVDFGMFQGGGNTEPKNCLPSGLDPKRRDAVLLTHAHLDHCGRLPLADGRIVGGVTRMELGDRWVLKQPLWIWVDSEAFPWHGLPQPEDLPATFEIDYIRVWHRK